MSELNGIAEVLTGDWEASFPRHYQIKAFLADAGRLRDLARKRAREYLTEAELAEVVELRKRIRRADADSVMMLVLKTRLNGGHNLF